MTSICEKKKLNIFAEFHDFTEAATRDVLQKKVLLKILQYSQKTPVLESLCRPSSLQLYQKETSTLMFSCEYCENFENTYFKEHLRTTAYFMKKNKHIQLKTKQLK